MQQGVIPFRFDFNPKDLKSVRYTSVMTNAAGNQNKVAVDVPIFQIGGSKSQLLHVLTKFRKAEAILSWTTGQPLSANWSNQLEDTSEWDTISNPFPQSVAGFNDAMEAYLEGEEPSAQTLKALIRKGTLNQSFVPVLCGSAFKNKGVQPLLDAVIDSRPSPLDVDAIKGVLPGEDREVAGVVERLDVALQGGQLKVVEKGVRIVRRPRSHRSAVVRSVGHLEDLGADWDQLSESGWKKAGELFAGKLECDSSRSYLATNRRMAADDGE